MKPNRRAFVPCLLIFLMLPNLAAYAQRENYVFVYLGIRDPESSLSTTELRVLENRLSAYLVQISSTESYEFLFPEDRSEVLSQLLPTAGRDLQVRELSAEWQPLARGIISGEINRVGTSLYLDLFIHSRSTGKLLLSRQDDFNGFDNLISSLQNTTFALFGLQTAPASGLSHGLAQQAPGPTFNTSPTLELIQGTWMGDSGLGRVYISQNGTATAELGENGANGTMQLQVRIENNLIRIRQDEPNAPKMYMAFFPYNIATQIVGLARPMTWEFRLSNTNNQLIGNKFTSYVSTDQGTVIRVDNTYYREAVWTRVE